MGGFQVRVVVKNLPASVGREARDVVDLWVGKKYLGVETGNPFTEYSCLENPMTEGTSGNSSRHCKESGRTEHTHTHSS